MNYTCPGEGVGSGLEQKRSPASVQARQPPPTPWGVLGMKWPIRAVPMDQVTLPFHLHSVLGCGTLGRTWPWVRGLCVHAKLLQRCLTLCNPMDCSPLGFSVHGILQVRILEWVAIPFFWGPSQPRDRTCLPRLLPCRWILYHGASGEARGDSASEAISKGPDCWRLPQPQQLGKQALLCRGTG